MKIASSITELIGNTPIVKLNRLPGEGSAEVYIKLEFQNPGGSVKDRIAIAMIEEAEKSGKLKRDDIIIEPTSGNTGIGLAMVAAAKGYKTIFVMPDTMSLERRKLLQLYGAKLILTPGIEGMTGAIKKAEELATSNPHYFIPRQFQNPANPKVHEQTTGPEIVEAFGKETLDAFVTGIGTGGTVTGAGPVLKEKYPNIKIYAIEPEESAVLSGGSPAPHKIQGIGAGFVPEILDTNIYDKVIKISSEDALAMARETAQKEGVLVGISSGATIKAALEIAKELGNGRKVLAIAASNGERYLSTPLYET